VTRLTRLAGAVGAVWGAVLLTRGRPLWRAVDGDAPGRVDEVGMLVLGARHLAQGAYQMARPGRHRKALMGVDVVHALSMVALAAVNPPRRRPALVSAAAAVAAATLTAAPWRT
jgi:hypothetical protein